MRASAFGYLIESKPSDEQTLNTCPAFLITRKIAARFQKETLRASHDS